MHRLPSDFDFHARYKKEGVEMPIVLQTALGGKRLQGAADVRRRVRRRISHTSSARQQSRCGAL